jgi:hypothetical protein
MLNSTRTYIFALSFLFLLSGMDSFAQTSAPEKEERPDKKKDEKKAESSPPVLGEILKPTIGLGAGNLAFFGDLYKKHFQAPSLSRFAYELNISQPLSTCLSLNFYVMFGKLGANERIGTRNENFESSIRLGGVQLMYDFNNLFKKKGGIRPYILTGIEGFEFLTKTDLKDKYGNTYYYWSDGSIKNMPQGSPGSQNAVNLVRDYTYESDVRELNKDGFGKYQERSFAIPVGAGFTMDVGERIKFRCGATMHFTFTDYIDGVTSKSVGYRKGTSANDKFMMMSASIHYDLVVKHKEKEYIPVESGHYDGVDFAGLDKGDEDGDGVLDWDDYCHGTPAGVKVDAKGCPFDDDKDMIPDHRDDELPTPATLKANGRGVGVTDPMAQNWYDLFYDTTGGLRFARIVNLDSIERLKKGLEPSHDTKVYTVELARYKGGIPSDEMAYLLSIGDVKSFTTGDQTVVYAAGEYKDVRVATKRKNEFVNEGLKDSRVGYFKGEDYFTLSDAELKAETDAADAKYGAGNVAASGGLKGQVVYRVQLGAYKNKLSKSMFKNVGDVIEMKTEDGYFRYASGLHKTMFDAAHHRAELVLEGYNDAFITAYKNGKRIPLSDAGATYDDKNYKEDIKETHIAASAIDANLVSFSVQIGIYKASSAEFEEKLKTLKDVSKQAAGTSIRFTAGNFKDYNDAVKYKKAIAQDFPGAFVVGIFKGEVISAQEAAEILLK